MRCSKCGMIFDEGTFCPECGTKCVKDNDVGNEENIRYDTETDDFSKASSILNEYEKIEKEKKIISEIGWSTEKELVERVTERIVQYNEVRKRELKTDYAKQMIQKMIIDLKTDYKELESKSVIKQRILAIFLTILSLSILFSFGIIGIIIGILLIIGSWMEVSDAKKAEKLKKDLEYLL